MLNSQFKKKKEKVEGNGNKENKKFKKRVTYSMWAQQPMAWVLHREHFITLKKLFNTCKRENHMINEQEMWNIYKNKDCKKGMSIILFPIGCSSIQQDIEVCVIYEKQQVIFITT